MAARIRQESVAHAQKQAWPGGHRLGIAIAVIISTVVPLKPVVFKNNHSFLLHLFHYHVSHLYLLLPPPTLKPCPPSL